jgi:hypothetical protein
MVWRKTWPLLVGLGLVVVAASNLSRSTRELPSDQNVRKGKPPLELATPHLESADRRILAATQQHSDAVSQLFNQARRNTDKFAKSALGWGSKWRIAADAIPYTRGDRNETYLREQFESQVLKGSDLEQAIEHCVTEFLADIRSIESKMLVDLKADTEGFPNEYRIGTFDEKEIQSHFDAAIDHAMKMAGEDLHSNISSQLVSIVVGEVLTQVAIRLGVSAGILGTGAASGWATLGVGVVVGIIIDQIVMTIWSQWSDPQANLVSTLNGQLDMMEKIICQGDDQTNGLLQQFQSIANKRSQLRRAAVLDLLGATEGAAAIQDQSPSTSSNGRPKK